MASASQLLNIYYNLEHTWDAPYNVFKAICEYRFTVLLLNQNKSLHYGKLNSNTLLKGWATPPATYFYQHKTADVHVSYLHQQNTMDI
jgi:lipoprotein NlpI